MNVRQLGTGITLIILAGLCNLFTAPTIGETSTLKVWFFLTVVIGGVLSALFGWGIIAALSSRPRTCLGTIAYFLGVVLLCGGIVTIGFGRMIIYLGGAAANAQALNEAQANDGLAWFGWSLIIAAMMFVGCIAFWSSLPSRPRLPDDEMYEDSEVYRTPVVSLAPLIREKLKIGADGELVEVAQSSDQGEIVLSGAGNQVTQVVYLDVGRYQIEYQFNTEQFCDMVLVSVDDVEIANLLVVRDGGHGSKTFAVQVSGRYTFEVQCPFAGVTWNFRCRLL